MRQNREGYGSYTLSVNTSQLPEKAICCVPVSFIASSCLIPLIHYPTTVCSHFTREKEGRKRDLLQPVLKADIDHQIRVVRGASCLLRGRGLNDTGEDEKRRERMGRIPLILTNMVYCVSV